MGQQCKMPGRRGQASNEPKVDERAEGAPHGLQRPLDAQVCTKERKSRGQCQQAAVRRPGGRGRGAPHR